MNTNTPWQCAPSIHLGIRSDQDIHIRLPIGPAMRGDRVTLAILAAFSSPRTFQQGLDELKDRITSVEQWATITTRISRLQKAGFLTEAASPNVLSLSGARFDAPPVHIRMLNDRARTSAYQRAIRETVASGDIVLDIGTGTGILAATAALSGAEHVYAIEKTSMAELAAEVFDVNGLSDRITVIRGHSTAVELPRRADVLVSEILGNDPLEEGILHVTADAIRRLLKPQPKLIPRRVDLFATLLSLPPERLNRAAFTPELASKWQDWYGLDFTPLVSASQNQHHSFNVNTYEARDWTALSEPVHLASMDLNDAGSQVVEFTGRAQARQDGTATGILVYFSADLSESVRLSLDPQVASPENSWSSYVWIPGRPVDLQKGADFELFYRFRLSGSEFEVRLR